MAGDKDVVLGKAIAEERKATWDKDVVLGKKAACTKWFTSLWWKENYNSWVALQLTCTIEFWIPFSCATVV